MTFITLVMDDMEDQLNYVAQSLRAKRNFIPFGADLGVALLSPSFMVQRASSFGSYDHIVTLDGQNGVAGLTATDNVLCVPYVLGDVDYEKFWEDICAGTLLHTSQVIVVDCNLSGDPDAVGSFLEGARLLRQLEERRLLPVGIVKVLYTGNPMTEPTDYNAGKDTKVVSAKNLDLVSAIILNEYRGYRDAQAKLKRFGLALAYARLLNSPSGADVGHGFQNTREASGRLPAEKLQLGRQHVSDTLAAIRGLGEMFKAAQVRTPSLVAEAKRVDGFVRELRTFDVGAADDLDELQTMFDAAFKAPVASGAGARLPLYRNRSVDGFEEWRERLCKVYLSHSENLKSWTGGLANLIRQNIGNSWTVVDKSSRNIEVFVPQEWLLVLFEYLSDARRFLKHHSRMDVGGTIVIRTDCWPLPKPSPATQGVFKAALVIGYDRVCVPPDILTREIGALRFLTHDTFGVESAKYLYELYLVAARPSGSDVYEFALDVELGALTPVRRYDGLIPIWPDGDVNVRGDDFLGGVSESAVVFLFESRSDQ